MEITTLRVCRTTYVIVKDGSATFEAATAPGETITQALQRVADESAAQAAKWATRAATHAAYAAHAAALAL